MSEYAVEMVLKENLKELRLPTILQEYTASSRAATENGSSYIDFLSGLTTLEVQERAIKRIRRRISEAQFPVIKTLDTFDLNRALSLSPHLVRELADCTFIGDHENVIIIGNSGTGKTHFATAIGIEACRKNYRVRFTTACQLVTDLKEARDDYRLKKLMDRMKRYDLLIVDELGYVPFSKPGAELLFQVLAERHEQKSNIITSNLAFPKWTDVFGDATLTAALLDRITHHCHILEFDWTSVRLQESQQKHMTGIEEVAPNKSVQKNKDGKKTEEKVQEEIDP